MSNLSKFKKRLDPKIAVLTDLRIKDFGMIVSLDTNGNNYYRQRLLAHGIIPGEILQITNIALLGDPIKICLSSGRSFILRKQEAKIIHVKKLIVLNNNES